MPDQTPHPSTASIMSKIDAMLRAVDPTGRHEHRIDLVDFSIGSTFNDGGRWWEAVFRLPGGTLKRARVDTDYRPDEISVTTVVAIPHTATEYRPTP